MDVDMDVEMDLETDVDLDRWIAAIPARRPGGGTPMGR
jgi:hypothetical protein